MQGIAGTVAGALALAMLGAVSGAVLTLVHQATVQAGDVTVPWGVIVALGLSAALLAGLRLIAATRLPAFAAAVGLLVVNALLALPTSGGSVLVQANVQGYAWTFGPVLVTAVVLGWPRLAQRREHRMDGEKPKGAEES